MEQSVFMEGEHAPGSNELSHAMGKCYLLWNELREYVFELNPSALEEWNFSKSGWNYRIKDKKRVVIYLMPGRSSFRASLVLGRKAVADALVGNLSEEARKIIAEAKVYAEGAGVRINVDNKKTLADIKVLVAIKTKY